MTGELDVELRDELLRLLGPSHPHDEGRSCGTCAAYNLLLAPSTEPTGECICVTGDGIRFAAINCPIHGVGEAIVDSRLRQPMTGGIDTEPDYDHPDNLPASAATPEPTLDAERLGLNEYERRLVESALKYYGDTMPAYAAAAGLSQADFALVMKDVRSVRAILARLHERTEP